MRWPIGVAAQIPSLCRCQRHGKPRLNHILKSETCSVHYGSHSGSIPLVEKLTCLATWKDGLLSYVIGKMEHALVSSDNDRYRCFVRSLLSYLLIWLLNSDCWLFKTLHFQVYEKLKGKDGMLRISQSPDATCYGLDHSNAGSRIMKFIKGTSNNLPLNCTPFYYPLTSWSKIGKRSISLEVMDMSSRYILHN